ncbi:GNAT family N-acetyltransferase [Mangrovihabitans endophyticus]|uniref:N-acetyltransferase n=1 Tax=Mangrovihabitans endophyticus TaxID=1751298 RepID=A0A8J3FNV4_9ACTN|nr:GNAT family N-acetyltransferase [Mangrovihabitans endophyticus]GGK90411.1 N-acetyltransferase [Mangrovihabitans endophyticus]
MVEIRPLTDADVDAVAQVHVHAWQVGYAGIIPGDYLETLDPVLFAERRRETMAMPDVQTLVAASHGQIIGFGAFGPYRLHDRAGLDHRHGELYALYVSPDRWGCGAGRALLGAAHAGLSAAGFPDLRLWVLEANARARRFYRRAGLRPDGARDVFTPRASAARLPEVRYATRL